MTHPRIARSSLTAATLLLVLAMARSALAQAWTPVAPMPTARARPVLAVVDGRIYAIGGFADRLGVAAVEIYDPATGTWSRGADMPEARGDMAVSAVGGTLFAIGGRSSEHFPPGLASAYAFTPGGGPTSVESSSWGSIKALMAPQQP